ncbi:nicotinamide mononucleotide deamidase-related protein [Infirmifilum lucidum]|uniref:Nicotinamide mononucleotide deamidase-related protein n=1 Tax=Infirmifilum lucidum TaxID=2776706 RepID=A0A7L9FFG4_9CREN|nr:nicotinamide mononucleotide deamidase-related protein [Infirmifilum lucidum]QOJ78520.1 nicotinamide mononucleotide deamidase-related protein [Infirmifilum lucidum]
MKEETAEGVTNKLEAEPPQILNEAMILSIGNELLIGKVLNTNAQRISEELTRIGFIVRAALTVRDDVLSIAEAFRHAISRRVQVVVSTGGLGPTFDDKTVEGLARALNRPLVLNEEALKLVREKYEARGLPLTPERVKMALLPLGAIPLENPVGTAPGVYVSFRGTHFFVLPGPPKEVEAILTGSVLPILRRIFRALEFLEASFIVRGIPESEFAPVVQRAARSYMGVYVKSHPRGFELGEPVLEIHLTTYGGFYRGQLAECFGFLVSMAKKMGGEVKISREPPSRV